jgi:multidrug resistance protein, MATE family
MGERPLAVSNIGRSLYILLMIPASALATTANTLVSNLIGAGRKEEVLPFVHRLMRMSILLVLPFAVITMIYPQYLAHIYTDDAYLIMASISTIRIIALANVLFAASFVVFNAVSGTGNTRTAFAIEFITLFFYIGYVYYTTNIQPSTVSVVWLSEFVYWVIIGSVGYIYLWKGNWQKKMI